jgi:hypothetical protein
MIKTIKTRKKDQYLQNTGAMEGSGKTYFKKMPIHWATENFFAFQIL